jgi:hypothetical protein
MKNNSTPGCNRKDSATFPSNNAIIERWVPQPGHSNPKVDFMLQVS